MKHTPPKTHQYVAGFAFSPDRQQVLLIRKARPAWQAGKLNGPGGRIEGWEETARGAMHREFREETGLETSLDQWKSYAMLAGHDWQVEFFFTELTAEQFAQELKPQADEPVLWFLMDELGKLRRGNALIENLPWLIYLALDCLEDGRPLRTEVVYP